MEKTLPTTNLKTYRIRSWDDTATGLWLCFDADVSLRRYLVEPPTTLLVGLPENESQQLLDLWREWRDEYASLINEHPTVVEAHWVTQPHGAWETIPKKQKEDLLDQIEREIMKKRKAHHP